MNVNRRILFILISAMVGLVGARSAQASTTKVGNGDDGADLEALTPLKDGPIVAARDEALLRLQRLNVAGIAGMGMVIPELQRSEMLMAKQDVRATTEATGAMEISDDRNQVYARTFAEANAATRFFPAANGLTREQLVALHIHEALHRALPADVREDENKVSHITMALTSPGATHDRVRQVAAIYMKPAPLTEIEYQNLMAVRTSVKAPPRELPSRSATKFGYQYSLVDFDIARRPGSPTAWHGLEFGSSVGGYRSVGSYSVEPYFRARMLVPNDTDFNQLVVLGTTSYELAARIHHEDGAITSPLMRFTARTIETWSATVYDRDIWTIGIEHQRKSFRSYLDSRAIYSFASSAPQTRGVSVEYRPILTLGLNGGWALGRWRLGGLAEVHSAQGRTVRSAETAENYDPYSDGVNSVDSYRLLAVGPEAAFVARAFEVRASYKLLSSSSGSDLSDLADVMDRGAGYEYAKFSVTATF